MNKSNSANNRAISELLKTIAGHRHQSNAVQYHELIEALGYRAFGMAILLFALPSALPLSAVPGFSFIFSLPICFFAIQLVFGKGYLWLPKALAKREVSTVKLARVINKCLPYIKKLERLLKPRALFFTNTLFKCLHGLSILILAVLLMLPIPLSNFIFSGLIILLALGLSERDGLLIAIAYLLSGVYLISIYTLVFTLIEKLL